VPFFFTSKATSLNVSPFVCVKLRAIFYFVKVNL